MISPSDLELGCASYNDNPSIEDCFFDADNELLICESRYVCRHPLLTMSSLLVFCRSDDSFRSRKRFHLRWLHNPKMDHPLASKPILDTGDLLKYPPGVALATVRTMMIGNYVLVEVYDGNTPGQEVARFHRDRGTSVILFWDWISGELAFVSVAHIPYFFPWAKSLTAANITPHRRGCLHRFEPSVAKRFHVASRSMVFERKTQCIRKSV